MSKDVFVFIEQRDGKLQSVGYELLGEAASLAFDLRQKVVAMLLGEGVTQYAEELIQYGADEVLIVDSPELKEYMTSTYTKAVTQIIKSRQPEIVLFGATSIGRDLAPRVSARIKTGLTADCTGLNIDPDTKLLMMTRPAFGGNLMAVIRCKRPPSADGDGAPGRYAAHGKGSRTDRARWSRLQVDFSWKRIRMWSCWRSSKRRGQRVRYYAGEMSGKRRTRCRHARITFACCGMLPICWMVRYLPRARQ